MGPTSFSLFSAMASQVSAICRSRAFAPGAWALLARRRQSSACCLGPKLRMQSDIPPHWSRTTSERQDCSRAARIFCRTNRRKRTAEIAGSSEPHPVIPGRAQPTCHTRPSASEGKGIQRALRTAPWIPFPRTFGPSPGTTGRRLILHALPDLRRSDPRLTGSGMTDLAALRAHGIRDDVHWPPFPIEARPFPGAAGALTPCSISPFRRAASSRTALPGTRIPRLRACSWRTPPPRSPRRR